jgi:O-acetyl-ADP-ribose deacetylase (regulator of RNase III)
MAIKYKVGDATEPEELADGKVLLAHCVNDEGIAGGGIALTIRQKWPLWYNRYHDEYKEYKLGDVQYVRVEDNLVIANIFGQKGLGINDVGLPAVRYEALYEGFLRLKKAVVKKPEYKLVTCRIGAGLAGGDFTKIVQLMNDSKLDVVVYDLAPVKTKRPWDDRGWDPQVDLGY